MKLLKLLEKTGEVAEIVGTVTSNPILKLGGKVVQEIIQDENETGDFLKELSNDELENLINSALKEKYSRI